MPKNILIRWTRSLRLLTLIVALCTPLATQAAASFTLVNLDGAGEGFNDPAAFTPVGGNTATTLGGARLLAFQYAANLLGGLITSGVAIRVEIEMNPLGGDAGSAPLGAAGPNTVYRDFSGAPVATTWYVEALANKLANADLGPVTNDIGAVFNSDVDNGTVLGTTNWYYGLDGNAGSDVDFVSVALHELVHGLGFLSLVDLTTGARLEGLPDAYMRHLEQHGATPPDYPSMTDPQRVTASISGPNLHWTGPAVTAETGSLSSGVSGGHVQMYGPNPQEPGSSVSHFDTALSPNQLMEPNYTVPMQTIGLAAQLLIDIGWSGTTAPPPGPPPTPPPPGPPPPPPLPSPCPTGPGSMLLPSGPTPFSCTDGSAGVCGTADPVVARPLGAVNVTGNLVLQLGFVPFAAPVDIYQLAQLPTGELFIMNSLKQWLPYPANTVAYRAGSSLAVNFDTLFQTPLASIAPGGYAAYTLVVPAGTDPATFSLVSSPYYLWCTTRSLP